MKIKTDPSTKPYYRCLSCPLFRKQCGGRPTRDMDLKSWCEYIRDVMDAFHLTIKFVAEKAEVSHKRIEQIRAINDDQDIMRSTARRIEQVVLSPATNHICDMDFDMKTTKVIYDLQSKVEKLEKSNARNEDVIDELLDKLKRLQQQ